MCSWKKLSHEPPVAHIPPSRSVVLIPIIDHLKYKQIMDRCGRGELPSWGWLVFILNSQQVTQVSKEGCAKDRHIFTPYIHPQMCHGRQFSNFVPRFMRFSACIMLNVCLVAVMVMGRVGWQNKYKKNRTSPSPHQPNLTLKWTRVITSSRWVKSHTRTHLQDGSVALDCQKLHQIN